MIKLSLLFALIAPVFAIEIREEKVEYAGAKFRVVRISPKDLQLVWRDKSGAIYRDFPSVQAAFTKRGKTVKFIMNAGIFEPGGIPSGLHIENAKPVLPLNSQDGKGNFFLKPNGVVSWNAASGKAKISPVEAWNKNETAAFAVQSGPLLLINGQRHPAFKDGSENRLHRNGVGVNAQHQLIFAITESREAVNLWDFAGLFLKLGCADALFLDGDISQMAVNPDKPVPSNQFGAMFVVAE